MLMRSPLEVFFRPRPWKKESKVLRVLGIALFFISVMMIPSLIVSIINSEDLAYILVPMLIGLAVSLFLLYRYKSVKTMRPVDGLLMIFAMWAMFFAFGIIPYVISGIPLIDALFESVAGFTTTGSTTIEDVTALSHGLLLWRSMTQWIGGIIIVIMFMFIIPMVVSGGRGVLRNEMSGSGGGNLFVKLGKAAKEFIIVYIILTVMMFVIIFIVGIFSEDNFTLLDAGTFTLSVISTGGFCVRADSFASFHIPIKIVTMVFMLLSATNFYLLYRTFGKREFGRIRKEEEFRLMLLWFTVVSIFVCILIAVNNLMGNAVETIVDVFFTVISFGTTTGFTVDMFTTADWTHVGISLVLLVMLIGGSSGSTAGGIKITRIIVIVKSLLNEMKKTIHPNAVVGVRLNGKGVDESVVHNATIVAVVFGVTVLVATAIFDVLGGENYDFRKAFFMSVSFISGTGVGINDFAGSFHTMGAGAKAFACILMFLGRMEIMSILVVLTPGFWQEVMGAQGLRDVGTKVRNIKMSNIKDKFQGYKKRMEKNSAKLKERFDFMKNKEKNDPPEHSTRLPPVNRKKDDDDKRL